MCDSCRSLDTDVLFPCRPNDADPLTIRRRAVGGPLVSSEPARRRGLGRSTRTREGHALAQPEPPSIAAATFTKWFPGASSGATPIRPGSRHPFTRRGGPPRGGSSLRARSTHAPGASRVSSWIRRRPTTSAVCYDPRTRPRIPIPACVSRHPCECRPSTGQARTPHSGGRPGGSEPRRPSVSSRPRFTKSPEHPSSSSRAFENRERSSQLLEATKASLPTP